MATNTQFTPGPWRIEGPNLANVFYVMAGEDIVVAEVDNYDNEGLGDIDLIAAAPYLYEALEHAVAFLRAAPLESGVCCCGNPIEGHGFGDGHSPVDELQYHAGGLSEKFAAVLAKARGEQVSA